MSTRVAALLTIAPLLLLASCDGSPVAEFDPPEEPEEPEEEISEVILNFVDTGYWTDAALEGTQGILSQFRVRVRATTPDGEPVPNHEITWRVSEGGGGFGGWGPCDRCPIRERPSEVTSTTTDGGWAPMTWILGPRVGEQEIMVSAPGAEPVVTRVEAVPGVVLVGVWRLEDAEEQARLPSDTIRIHATNHDRSYPMLARLPVGPLPEGQQPFFGGRVMRGSGVDPTWNFHFDPTYPTTNFFWGIPPWCWSSPFHIEDRLDEQLGDAYIAAWSMCSRRLQIVGVEEVPQSYLDALAAEAGGS